MTLAHGDRLGSYEGLGKLGEGGMGEVYRARDTKLNRDVAIKVLPEAFALDADRLARFTREAQVLASLNHPNIAGIYGLEESSVQGPGARVQALVMELVEGQDLSELIGAAKATPYESTRGAAALSLPDALAIARQIADALEAAHEQGIVHRDLKPQNIKVRADGTVKVLDFGLAKAMDRTLDSGPGTLDPANSPTLTARATQMGMIIGTAAYMSPEQARGRAVDRRADIWSFGVVLYEMLTGRRAFHGEDISITLASVLKEDVSWDSLPAGLPIPIVRLLRRCLEKDPKRRLSSIGDARLEIDEALQPSADPGVTGARVASSTRSGRLPWTIAAIASALLVTAVGTWWLTRVPSVSPEVVQFTISNAIASLAMGVSPDGRMVAFVDRAETGGLNAQIWIRRVDVPDAYRLPGTEGATMVFWSPDSQSVGFLASGKLQRIAVSGGAVQTIGESQTTGGAIWTPGGDVVFGTTGGSGGQLYRVSANGGVPVELARPDPARQENALLWPSMLPDGRRFIYLAQTNSGGTRTAYVGSLDGGAAVALMPSESQVVYTAPGYLLFVRGTTLFAQKFDADSLTISGQAVRVADGIQVNLNNGRATFSVSSNGVPVYRSGGGLNVRSTLRWLDRKGTPQGAVGDAGDHYQIRLSPDGKRVALLLGGTASQTFALSVLDLANGVTSAMTDNRTTVNDPVWLPDSQTIGYGATKDGLRQIFSQRVGASTPTQVFSSTDNPKWLDDWSADGAYFLFHMPRPSKLFAVKAADPAKPMILLDTTETIDGAHFSPDGKWIAYQITEDGIYQVWVASFPAFDQRRRVSPKGGGQAFWRGDGKELFYLTPDGKLMSAPVTRDDATGGVSVGAPGELFQSPLAAPTMGTDQYSVTRDGQRFLFMEPVEAGAVAPLNVVVNWTTGLGAK